MISQITDLGDRRTVIIQSVMDKLQELPLEQQQEVLNFVELLTRESAACKSIWDEIEDIVKNIPEEEWDSIPSDGASQHDRYLYGTPKKEV